MVRDDFEIKMIPTPSGLTKVVALVGGEQADSHFGRDNKETWDLVEHFTKKYGMKK